MSIEISFSLTEEEQAQIEELFAACRRKEPLSLSPLIPCAKDDRTVFFYREAGRLLSVLETAPFSPGVLELRAFTRPEARKTGCFRRLFLDMTRRFFPDGPEYEPPKFFFYDDESSRDTAGFIRRFSCPKLDTDHLLSLEAPWPNLKFPIFSAAPCPACDLLARVHGEVFGWPVSESAEYLTEALTDPGCRAFLIRENNRPAGCFLLTSGPEAACLSAFGLTPAFRGKNLSDTALRLVFQCLPSRCQRLNVQVSESNEPAYRLYQKAGFLSVNRLSSYLFSGFLA